MLVLKGGATDDFSAEAPPAVGAHDITPDLALDVEGVDVGTGRASIVDDALERARRDVLRASEAPTARLNLGILLFVTARYEEARDELRKVLRLRPDHQVALSYLARTLSKLGAADEAVSILESSPAADSNAPLLVAAKIAIAQDRGDTQTVSELLHLAVESDSSRLEPRIELAKSLIREGRSQEAIRILRSCLRDYPRAAAAHHVLAVAYALRGNRRRARRELEVALRLNPLQADSRVAYTKLLIEERDYTTALDMPAPTDMLPISARCELREARAWCAFQLGEHRAARRELMNVIADAAATGAMAPPMLGRLTNNLGVCYVLLANRENAEIMFKRSIEVASDVAAAPYTNLGRLYFSLGRYGDSERIASACIRLFPQEADQWILAGVSHYYLGNYDAAVEELRTACACADAPSVAFASLGTVLADAHKDFSAAVECLVEGRRRWPQDIVIANNLAYVYLRQGNLKDAEAILVGLPFGDNPYPLATNGLLSLMRGELEAGRQGYEAAEKIALQQGNRSLARMVRQKWHVEVGRAYERVGRLADARREAFQGLKVKDGNPAYRRELEVLWSRLEADSSEPMDRPKA